MANLGDRICFICSEVIPTKYKLINHIKKLHAMTWVEYVKRSAHDGITPMCKCECGQETSINGHNERFNDYIQGHNRIELSQEAKQTIGQKNSLNMIRYHAQHRDEAIQKAAKMRQHLTPDVVERRNASVRKALQDPEFKALVSKNSKLMWNNKELLEQAAEKRKYTWHERNATGAYDDMKQKLSKMMTQKLLNNERIWQQGTYEPKKSIGPCRYKSSWELEGMRQLDACSAIDNWRYEKLSIPYIDPKGQKRRHIPDFQIELATGERAIIEIKPKKWLLNSKFQQAKIEAAKKFCASQNIVYGLWDITENTIESLIIYIKM